MTSYTVILLKKFAARTHLIHDARLGNMYRAQPRTPVKYNCAASLGSRLRAGPPYRRPATPPATIESRAASRTAARALCSPPAGRPATQHAPAQGGSDDAPPSTYSLARRG
eukprot:scaffold81731_cov42-Phaeocystis_antarctica.AAC.1